MELSFILFLLAGALLLHFPIKYSLRRDLKEEYTYKHALISIGLSLLLNWFGVIFLLIIFTIGLFIDLFKMLGKKLDESKPPKWL